MLRRVAVAAVVVVAASISAAAPAADRARVQATFVGDSVPASITYVPAAERRLRRGIDVRLDLRVCRRLVQQSCAFQGAAPPTALSAVEGYGRTLGDVLVVQVGHNESAYGYRRGIDLVMRAALADGARRVVWVTLRETLPTYRETNVAIRAASRRWPALVVADWNAHSRGKPWFAADGLHLTSSGANALVSFLRPFVLDVANG